MNNLSNIPWPENLEQINMAMIEDIATKVADSTGANPKLIRHEIFDVVNEHYKKTRKNKSWKLSF